MSWYIKDALWLWFTGVVIIDMFYGLWLKVMQLIG